MAQPRWFVQQNAVCIQADMVRIGAKIQSRFAEHVIADRKARYIAAHGHNFTRKAHPRQIFARAAKP